MLNPERGSLVLPSGHNMPLHHTFIGLRDIASLFYLNKEICSSKEGRPWQMLNNNVKIAKIHQTIISYKICDQVAHLLLQITRTWLHHVVSF